MGFTLYSNGRICFVFRINMASKQNKFLLRLILKKIPNWTSLIKGFLYSQLYLFLPQISWNSSCSSRANMQEHLMFVEITQIDQKH